VARSKLAAQGSLNCNGIGSGRVKASALKLHPKHWPSRVQESLWRPLLCAIIWAKLKSIIVGLARAATARVWPLLGATKEAKKSPLTIGLQSDFIVGLLMLETAARDWHEW